MPTPPVRPLDLTDDRTARAVHRIGLAAYAVEAELIGFDGIPRSARASRTCGRGRCAGWGP